MKKLHLLLLAIISTLVFYSCNQDGTSGAARGKGEKLKVVSTTTQITDLLVQLAGNKIELNGLMGPGVDPHLYKASEGDVSKLFNADVIFYNGLHLEGKIDDLFEKMQKQGKQTLAVANAIPEPDLITVGGSSDHHDPHIWFSVSNWKLVASYVAQQLIKHDQKNVDYYDANLKKYLGELDKLSAFNDEKIAMVPESRRVLITAHDAFEYFGREYGFEVKGLQGISTVSEAGAADVKALADFIAERKIPALFIESSVPHRNIEALQAAVRSRGFDVKIGGELFSDALGSTGTPEGTYIGMYKHNVLTIANALK
jgi:manganese/zinc/iron transport system substrate-binding protein